MRYSSIESINTMLRLGNYTSEDINQALADLEAMYERKSINEYQYKNMKALLEAKK